MARHKEYDRQDALDIATDLFWEKGYAGTSVRNLVHATGIHHRSMYGEFGDKETLFLACLKNYANKTVVESVAILSQEPRSLPNIETFFRKQAASISLNDFKGCMIANTAMEKDQVGDSSMQEVERLFHVMEKEFLHCLKGAQALGEIPMHANCRVLATYLMCFLQGLMVRGKTTQTLSSAHAIVDTLLATLKS